jgi:hypothetical protein
MGKKFKGGYTHAGKSGDASYEKELANYNPPEETATAAVSTTPIEPQQTITAIQPTKPSVKSIQKRLFTKFDDGKTPSGGPRLPR